MHSNTASTPPAASTSFSSSSSSSSSLFLRLLSSPVLRCLLLHTPLAYTIHPSSPATSPHNLIRLTPQWLLKCTRWSSPTAPTFPAKASPAVVCFVQTSSWRTTPQLKQAPRSRPCTRTFRKVFSVQVTTLTMSTFASQWHLPHRSNLLNVSFTIVGGAHFLGHRPIVNGQPQAYKWQSYVDVSKRVTHFGAGLAHLGLSPKQNFGIFSINRPEWVGDACFLLPTRRQGNAGPARRFLTVHSMHCRYIDHE